ncbi:hypothetical protein M0R45_034425 [Rubus argutus]|uniref:Leucine-rich repeat-containing N-terminal plant-type domain-containing protein n=1 Tax=Rubus argutus TaxID=59490 RepID=A0AAW1VVI9_RUBAR
MELGKWLQHAYAISIVVLLHIIASLSLGHHHANVTRCVERERHALLAVKRDLVDNHNLLSSWGSGSEAQMQDCCRWERVYCDNKTGHVLRLDLGSDNRWPNSTDSGDFFSPAFEGTIIPQLTQLHNLTYLNLSYNSFNESEIPAFIGSLTSLRYLDLSWAGFGGQIPFHALGNLTHLTYLDLSDNDFNGSQIPAFIGSLTSLRYLDLSQASFIGQIPSHALGNLTHLQYLNLGFNYFYHYYVESLRETLLVENLNWLPHLSSLKYLDLSDTNLSNVFDWLETVNKLPNLRNLSLSHYRLPPPIIPNSFSHINTSKSLARVDLSSATTITSSIFKWLCNYNTTLVHLDLSFTQLSGLIPYVFKDMNSLEVLSLSDNQLSGLIPDVFRNMSSLAHLDLSNNPLEGGIPKSISQLCSL